MVGGIPKIPCNLDHCFSLFQLPSLLKTKKVCFWKMLRMIEVFLH